MSVRRTGSCFCEKLKFSYEPPSLWSAHCHCSVCRRSHGAAFVTWVGIALEQFSMDQDQTLTWYESSAGAKRGFCSACGSTVFFQSENWPGEMHVARACFDGAIDREPTKHGYWESHVDWLQINDGLPRSVST